MPMVVEALQKADEANTLQTIQPHVDYCSKTFSFPYKPFARFMVHLLHHKQSLYTITKVLYNIFIIEF